MPLPILTPEQRAAAAAAATAARAKRAKACARLKSGEMTVSEILEAARSDAALAKLRVTTVLQSLPGIGSAKAGALMKRLQISESRRLRGLGPHQEAALLGEFDDR